MKGLIIRGWDLILSRCGGTWMLARGVTLPVRWLYAPQPINDYPMRGGAAAPCGMVSTRVFCFCPRVVRVVDELKKLSSGDGNVFSRCVPGLTNHSQPTVRQWGRGFHTVRGWYRPSHFRPWLVGVADIWRDF